MSAAVIPLERSSTTSSSRLSFSGSLTHSSSTFTSASCPPSPGQLKLNCLENSYNSLKARPSSREAILSNPGNAFETAHSIACQSTDSPHAAAAVSLAKCRSSSECHTRSDSTSFVIPHGALSFKSKEFQCECDPETRMTPAQAICDTHVVKSEVPFCGRTLMEETTGRTSRYIEDLHHDVTPAEIAAFSGDSSQDPALSSFAPRTWASRRPSQNSITRPRSMFAWIASTEAPSIQASSPPNRSPYTANATSNTVHRLNASMDQDIAFSPSGDLVPEARRFSLSSTLRRPRPSSMVSSGSAASCGLTTTPHCASASLEEGSCSRLIRRTSGSSKIRRTWKPTGNLLSPSEEEEQFSFTLETVNEKVPPSNTVSSGSLKPRWRRFIRKITPLEHRLETTPRLESGVDTTPRAGPTMSYNWVG